MGVSRTEKELAAIKNEVGRIADARSIQADWNQADNTKVDFIKNKPVVATGSTDGKKIFLNSSTASSTKVFEIKVTDDGTLTATEVVADTE